jgi:uncharacterized protein
MEGNNVRARGFAAMDAERQREIARKGGKAAHERGTAHEFTTDEARAAGRKGGERVSTNRQHMAEIGRLGGKSSAVRRSSTSKESNPDRGEGSEMNEAENQMSEDRGAMGIQQ